MEPSFPAMIHAPNHPFEPPLIFISSWGYLSDCLSDDNAEPPDYWRATDRIIDSQGRIFRIFWTGSDFFDCEIVSEGVKAEECKKLLLEYHQFVGRRSDTYLRAVQELEGVSL